MLYALLCSQQKSIGSLCCMHCYVYSRKTFWFTMLYTLLVYSRKKKKNVLAHCAVYIVMHTQEKKKKKSIKKSVASLYCIHCYVYSPKTCWLTVLYALLWKRKQTRSHPYKD